MIIANNNSRIRKTVVTVTEVKICGDTFFRVRCDDGSKTLVPKSSGAFATAEETANYFDWLWNQAH